MFLHAFYTWLLANLLHPLMLLLLMNFTGEDIHFVFNAESFGILVQLFFYSLLFSLPCLLVSWLLLGIIVFSDYIIPAKFVLWLLTAATLIFLEWLVILFLVDELIEIKLLLLIFPAIAATWIAIAFRWRQFKNLIYHHQKNNHEDNLV